MNEVFTAGNLIYYCQDDGAQWNVPVYIVYGTDGLYLIRGNTLGGKKGENGEYFYVATQSELFLVAQE